MPNVSFSSINVLNGEELGDTPQVSLQSGSGGKRSARSGETLIVFVDLPNASPTTCADVARTLGDGYARAPGGLTSALRLGIKLANNRVLELNKGAPPQNRLEGSVSCALLTPESVILAQAGSAVAFARSANGAFEVIAPPLDGTPETVGTTTNINVHFNNFTPQAGDVFVLSGAHSVTGVADGLVETCMGKGDARLVAGYLNANVKRGRMVAVAISVDDGAAVGAKRAPTPAAEPVRATTPTMPSVPPVEIPGGPSRANVVREDVSAAASQMGETVVAGMNQAARSIQRSMGAFGGRLLPEEPIGAAQERSRAATFILAAIAIVLPIVIGVAVATGYFQFSGEAERLQTQSNAKAQIAIAESRTDPAQVRAEWARALELVAAYETKSPADKTTFGDVKLKARQQLDGISKVTRIQPLALAQFEGSAARRIAAAPLGIYTLDPATRAADFYTLNAERTAVAGKKAQITFTDASSTTTSSLMDIAAAGTFNDRWRTEGAVFFSPGAIYEYASASGRASPLTFKPSADATPQTVLAGELYNNAAYLLDIGVGQIWKYQLAGSELGAGTSYFRSPYAPLKDCVDFAIDGAIYLLQKSGTVLKYYGRQSVQFAVAGLPDPFTKVAAIAISGPDQFRGSVYVLDGGAGSVVELDKSGRFIRQYRGEHDEFANAQDMSFDPTSNTLYVATPDRLYSFAVQAPSVALPVATPVGEKAPEVQPQP